jgi:hypothetical protein
MHSTGVWSGANLLSFPDFFKVIGPSSIKRMHRRRHIRPLHALFHLSGKEADDAFHRWFRI